MSKEDLYLKINALSSLTLLIKDYQELLDDLSDKCAEGRFGPELEREIEMAESLLKNFILERRQIEVNLYYAYGTTHDRTINRRVKV